MPVQAGRAVAPGSPVFELHTLGWRAFQDLCAAVLRQVWGQSVQAFADSNDAGRDGGFYGIWDSPAASSGMRDLPAGPFVVQCKHTRNPGGTLSPSGLEDEFRKVPALVRRGLCGSYVLMTNARVTGRAEAEIRDRLRRAGVAHPLVLGYQWLCDMIAGSRELRLFVPRVYGLGDLSQVLDERAYAQASVLMASARDQVATFVVTEPYRKAAEAIRAHGFVLLLGEPAVGKSVIALMLAVAAADNWGCLTVKARTASELVDRWNPHEPGQFFWVDDAFGAVRHDEQLTGDWTRSMPHVMAAIGKGARVVLTSRDYIYQDARPLLKDYSYPRLREQQVTVDVEDVSILERRQILYNHIAYGDQPAEVRRKLKPFLEHAAAVEPFRPEMARRLGLRSFTAGLDVSRAGVEKFMAHPRQLLRDVYTGFGADEQAALTLVYAAARDGHLESPLALDEAQRDIIARAGSTAAGTARALQSLTGSFLLATEQPPSIPDPSLPPLPGEPGSWSFARHRPGWAFRHPTLSEGFASWLSGQPHLLGVVLAGLTDDMLLTSVDCEAEDADEAHGILLRMPPALYRQVAERISSVAQRSRKDARYGWQDLRDKQKQVLAFLAQRSSNAFLRVYLEVDPGLPGRLAAFTSFLDAVPEPAVLARLHQAHLLGERTRLAAVEHMTALAVGTPDAGWLHAPAWQVLLSPAERARLMDTVRTDLVPRFGTDDDPLPGEREEDQDPFEAALIDYREAFKDAGDLQTAAAFDDAIDAFREAPTASREHHEDYRPDPDHGRSDWTGYRSALASRPTAERSIFDDVDR